MTPSGQVTWSFGASSGPDMLDKPSLAVRLPNGLIAANDDYNDRVILIDPRTKRIVWQYGHTGVASSANGYLSKPDGIEFLPAKVVGAPHQRQRGRPTAAGVRVTTVGHLPSPASRLAAVSVGGGRVLVLGGLVNGSSSTEILAGTPGEPPSASARSRSRPTTTPRCSSGAAIYLLGGGQATSSDAIVRVSTAGAARKHRARSASRSPISAPRSSGNTAYIAGGYTGSQYATGILAFRGHTPHLAARLPVGLRYAGVAALGRPDLRRRRDHDERDEQRRLPLRPGDRGRLAGRDAAPSRSRTRRSSRSAARST